MIATSIICSILKQGNGKTALNYCQYNMKARFGSQHALKTLTISLFNHLDDFESF